MTAPNLLLLSVSGIYAHERLDEVRNHLSQPQSARTDGEVEQGEIYEWGLEVRATCIGRPQSGNREHARVAFFGFVEFSDLMYAYAFLRNRHHTVQTGRNNVQASLDLSVSIALDCHAWLQPDTLLSLRPSNIVWLPAAPANAPARPSLLLEAHPVTTALKSLIQENGVPAGSLRPVAQQVGDGGGGGQGGSGTGMRVPTGPRGGIGGGTNGGKAPPLYVSIASLFPPFPKKADAPPPGGTRDDELGGAPVASFQPEVTISQQAPLFDLKAPDGSFKIHYVPATWLPLEGDEKSNERLSAHVAEACKIKFSEVAQVGVFNSNMTILPGKTYTSKVHLVVRPWEGQSAVERVLEPFRRALAVGPGRAAQVGTMFAGEAMRKLEQYRIDVA
ncbi:hypothetical protein JCM8097_006799 [Rhodosporidiobolus ruineniae]